MPPAKKTQAISLIDSLEGILRKDQYKLSENGSEQLYTEIPVDILTFVVSPDWLGIAPQINPDTGERALTPLSDGQLDFLRNITDFDNEVNDYVLWVG